MPRRVDITVSLMLSDPETGRGALGAEEWKDYPHGVLYDEAGYTPRILDAMCEDALDDLQREARQFITNQYEQGAPPLAWKIVHDGKVLDHGTEHPGEKFGTI